LSRAATHFKNAVLILLGVAGVAGWLALIYIQHRANQPIEIVKKHFVFYPEYSHGTWREAPCSGAEKCREVTYTIPVKGCGPVTFDWRVQAGDDRDPTWSYNGANPKFDEDKYALYAVLSEDSRLIDSPALGKPVPDTCQMK
jgi:hypothetical protein